MNDPRLEPWVCVKCGETVVPMNADEVWRYAVTGESRATPCFKVRGVARPHAMAKDELARRYPKRARPYIFVRPDVPRAEKPAGDRDERLMPRTD